MTFSDHLNPILVREARQAVRSGYVVTWLMALPAGLTLITLFNLQLGRATQDDFFQSGQTLFTILNGLMQPFCIFAIPMYVGVRMAMERSQADLLFITGLTPRSVVHGKLSIALVISLQALAIFLPFGLLCHILRGIDIPTIVGAWYVNMLTIFAASMWALFIGSITMRNAFTKMLGYSFMAAGTLICYLIALVFNLIMLESGAHWIALIIFSGFAAVGMLFLYGISMTTLESAMNTQRYATYSPGYAPAEN